uniref:PRA1 family protein n=1 Tax=Macrostomum lignano TaxID=282301 RepID=A0A1I8F8A3_9PLAT
LSSCAAGRDGVGSAQAGFPAALSETESSWPGSRDRGNWGQLDTARRPQFKEAIAAVNSTASTALELFWKSAAKGCRRAAYLLMAGSGLAFMGGLGGAWPCFMLLAVMLLFPGRRVLVRHGAVPFLNWAERGQRATGHWTQWPVLTLAAINRPNAREWRPVPGRCLATVVRLATCGPAWRGAEPAGAGERHQARPGLPQAVHPVCAAAQQQAGQ